MLCNWFKKTGTTNFPQLKVNPKSIVACNCSVAVSIRVFANRVFIWFIMMFIYPLISNKSSFFFFLFAFVVVVLQGHWSKRYSGAAYSC